MGFAGSCFFLVLVASRFCCFSLFKPGFSIAQRFFPGGYDFFLVLVSFLSIFSVFFVFFRGDGGYRKIDRLGAFGVTG